MEDRLKETLESWGLPHLYDVCVAKRFSLSLLLKIDSIEPVRCLSEFEGEQWALLEHIRERRKQLETRASPEQPQAAAAPSTTNSTGDINEAGPSSRPDFQPPQKRKAIGEPSNPVAKKIASSLGQEAIFENLDVEKVLSKHVSAKEVLKYYRRELAEYNSKVENNEEALKPLLREDQRNSITAALMEKVLLLCARPRHQNFPILTKKLVALFPTESEVTYYRYEKGCRPFGKFPTKVRNLLANQRNAELGAGTSRSSEGSQSHLETTGLQNILSLLNATMPRQRDPVRDCFIESSHGTKEKATCKYCGKTYAHNTCRMRNYIAKECVSVPDTIRRQYVEVGSSSGVGSSSSASVNEEYMTDNPSGDSRRSASPTPSSASACASTSTSLVSLDQRGTKRKSLDRFVDSTSTQEKALLDAMFARAVYASGMPLSSFTSPYWESFFSKMRPSYKVPSPYFLSGPLLNAEYSKCQASNAEKIQKASALGIMTDSYTNVRHESVIDIVVTTPKPVMYKQVFRGQNRESGEYVANELLLVIREIGPDKFWILVTDNAANMKVAWEIVTMEFPHITAIGCASHCWNLLFKDLIEIISTVAKYYQYARNVVRQIKVSSNILATLKAKQLEKYGKNAITLKLPGKTRWAGAVILLNSLLKNKSALQETVIDDELDIKNNIRKCVLEPRFWTRIKCVSDLLTPIHAAITLIESNRALLSDVYFLYRKINDCVLGNMSKLRLTAEEKIAVKELLASRKEFTISSIHLAAYMLDPRYIGDGLDAVETGEAINCISRLAAQAGVDEAAAIANLGELRNREGFFSTPP